MVMSNENILQYETMAAIRAYAIEIAAMPSHDIRPSTALSDYQDKIKRMHELAKKLNGRS